MEEKNTMLDSLRELEQRCDEYEKKLSLNTVVLKEVDHNLSKDDLFNMTSSQIYGYCYEMANYLFGLQKEINKQISRMNWAEYNLNRLLERENNNYKGFGWSERKSNVIVSNVAAQKLDHMRITSKFEVDRISFLTNRIQYQIDFAKDIAYGKRRVEYGSESRS